MNKGDDILTINEGIKFIYADETSDSHGVLMATAFSGTTRSGNVENRNIVTTANNATNTFNFHYVKYDSPLTFDIIIYNEDGSFIDAQKERSLKKWLLKNKRNWFKSFQPDLADTEFYCIATSASMLDVGAYSGGMMVSFQCDAPWAWTKLRKKTYSSIGSLNFSIKFNFDFDEYILQPQLIIIPTASGTISIANAATGETISIAGCVSGETIQLDNLTDQILTTASRNIVEAWNRNTIGFIEGNNSITLTGKFNLELRYRLPVRVGA